MPGLAGLDWLDWPGLAGLDWLDWRRLAQHRGEVYSRVGEGDSEVILKEAIEGMRYA